MYIYKAKNVHLYFIAAYQYSISQIVEKTKRILYHIMKAHKLPHPSFQSISIHRTSNMSLDTLHITIFYNTTTDTITALICKVSRSINSLKIFSVTVCLIHLLLTISCKKNSVPLNYNLYLPLTSLSFHCVEMFNCTDSLWNGMTELRTILS